MKVVKQIFCDDILALFKNFFALVIAIGICFLPALYAWFNIYSNWDPYGNTGALKMAVYSEDKGYTTDDGTYQNQGDTIIENLHENTSVDWQFVDSAEEAIDGVESGDYYAAVVIDENFTYAMYNVFSDENMEPTLKFYENQKKNPVATKISDTVVSTLQNNINEAFVEVVISQVFSSAGLMYDNLEDDGGVDGIVENLKTLNEDLTEYQDTISSVIASDKILINNLESAQEDTEYLEQQSKTSADSVTKANSSVASTQVTINTYTDHLNTTIDTIKADIADMQSVITAAELSEDYQQMNDALNTVLVDLQDIKTNKAAITQTQNAATNSATEQALEDQAWATQKAALIAAKKQEYINQGYSDTEATTLATNDVNNSTSEAEFRAAFEENYYATQNTADEYIDIIEKLALSKSNSMANDVVETSEEAILETLEEIYDYTVKLENSLNSEIIPSMNDSIDALEVVLNNTTSMLNSMSETFGSTTVMFVALSATLESADTSLEKTNEALAYINEKLSEAIEKVEAADTEEKLDVLVETLAGDPEVYGKFFSEPVEITTEAVYPIANYGSAVAPFYTTLALWVGALILTAIIKVHPDKTKYPDATNAQLYFGRLMLYLLLGQLQSAIIVIGDLSLIGIQCVEPGWFFLASALTSLTFTVFIYSLVVTWGDVGKALSVVIVVLQIAGSSGTYPIELLPEFFQKVYIFFPFPYAINAMRECTCGMYENDYLIYLLQLSLFIIVSLVIGLLLKIPFEGINHYMEERMEETEMM